MGADETQVPAQLEGSGKHPVCWIDFTFSDWEKSSEFYREAFGWSSNPFREDYHIFQPPSGVMGGFSSRARQEGRCPVIYLFVPDVDEALERVVAAGGEKVSDKEVLDPESGKGVAYFRDPAGVLMGFSDIAMPEQAVVKPFGEGEKPQVNTICAIELYGGDLAGTGSFYRELFGWHTSETMPQYLNFHPGSGVGGVFQSHTPAAPCVAYVYVNDVHEAMERVARLGAQKMGDPMKVPGFGTFGYFVDPGGMALGLIGP